MTTGDPASGLSQHSAQLVAAAQRRAEAAANAEAQVRAISATAASSDGGVRATVDAGGMLTSLFVASNPELARRIVEAVQQAAAQARAQARRVYEPLHAKGLLRDPPLLLPEPVPAQPAAPQARPRRQFDDQEELRGVLRDEPW
jgi:hypothetical protein